MAADVGDDAEIYWSDLAYELRRRYPDRVRVSVTRDEDAYSADRYGVLVNYSEDTNTATIETARSVLRVMGEAGFRILSTETIKACPTA